MIEDIGSGNAKATLKQNPSTDAISGLIQAPGSREQLIIQPSGYAQPSGHGMKGRTMSASTLDGKFERYTD